MNALQMGMPLIVAGGFFLASMMLVFGTYQIFALKGRRQRNIDKIRGTQPVVGTGSAKAGNGRSRFAELAVAFSKRMGKDKEFLQGAYDSPARLQFLQAGLRGRNAPALFWTIQSLLFLALPAGVAILWGLKLLPLKPLHVALAVGGAGFLGYSVPRFWLDHRIRTRRNRIRKALPDVLDLLVVCVEAGTGLYAGLNTVAVELKTAHPEMSDELRFMDLEIRAGKLREQALQDLATRIGLEEMTSLTSLLTQSDRFGTDLAKSLRTYSHVFRKQRFQAVEKLAAVLPVKMMLPLILFIMPSLFVVIIGPAAIRIVQVLFPAMQGG